MGDRDSRRRRYWRNDDDRRKSRRSRKWDDDDDDDDKDDERRGGFGEGVIRALDSSVANNLIKLAATGVIAATTLGIYLIGAITRLGEGALQLPTLAFGAVATAAVWLFGKSKKNNRSALTRDYERTIDELKERIGELEERVANVEIIESLDRRLARQRADEMAREQGNFSSPVGSGDEAAVMEDGTVHMPLERETRE